MMREVYDLYDRSDWPDEDKGWGGEPDKAQWTDEDTGLPCLAVRNRLGGWCGYVGITKGHVFYGKDYETCLHPEGECPKHQPHAEDEYPYCRYKIENIIDVHGSVTFTSKCSDRIDEPEHPAICHIPEPGATDDVWWIGFDTAHAFDYVPGMHTKSHETWAREKFPEHYTEEREQFRREMMDKYWTLGDIKEECAHLADQLADPDIGNEPPPEGYDD